MCMAGNSSSVLACARKPAKEASAIHRFFFCAAPTGLLLSGPASWPGPGPGGPVPVLVTWPAHPGGPVARRPAPGVARWSVTWPAHARWPGPVVLGFGGPVAQWPGRYFARLSVPFSPVPGGPVPVPALRSRYLARSATGPVARSGPVPSRLSLSRCPAPVSMSPPCRSSVGPAPAPTQTVCCLHHVLDKINKQLYMVCFKGAAKIGPSCRDARQVCDYLWDSGRKINNNKA